MKRKILSIGTAVLLCFVLITAYALPVLAQPQAVTASGSWAEDIPAMLSSGSYAEGEVIVGVLASDKSITGDELLADSEELFDVTGADIEDPDITVSDNVGIDIIFIQRDDLTTEEILYRLAGKRNVVFAEPNYLMDTEDASEEAPEDILTVQEDPASEADPEAALEVTADPEITEESSDKDAEQVSEEPEITEDPSEENVPEIITETITQNASSEAKNVSVRLDNIADLTWQQWSSWDGSSYIIEGQGGNSIHVPNFAAQTGDMEGEPVVVAVMDSSIDFTHPDLEPVAYTFTPEQRQILGCDVHGFNATSESSDGILTYNPEDVHGMHCAGIIGADWDGQGISGVASNVKLVSIQNHVHNGYTSMVNALHGYEFIDRANELGCKISIVSNSWGLKQDSRALDAVIRNIGEKWGVLTVFAAGNDGMDTAAYGDSAGSIYDNPYVIIVAAMDSAGKISSYSNYGYLTVDLGAPGSGILSTINTNAKYLQYFADALQDNKFYNGFEEGVIPNLKWLDPDDKEIAVTAEITDTSCFAGTKGLKITLPGKDVGTKMIDGRTIYTLQINLGDVTSLGVKAGDYLGFTLGAAGSFGGGGYRCLDKTTGKLESVMGAGNVNTSGNGWINAFFEIPENADLTNLKFSFGFVPVDDSMESIYMDSIGIGSALVPYTIMDGTSMACPCVAGVAAVVKSENPEASGTELAALVKAKVSPNESLAGLTKTGGMIDFLADGTPGSAQTAYNPSILDVAVYGKTVTITGANFTDSGKAVASQYVAGKAKDVKNAQVVSWTDTEVVLSLAEYFDGILEVDIENQDGKYDTYTKFVSKSDNLYEEDLPFDKSTGEPYVFDADGDYETNGPLIGLDNKLYYFPCLMETEETQSYKRMRCFDIQSLIWEDLPEIPEWLTHFSAVMYDGKIVVKGTTMVLAPDGAPQWDSNNTQLKIYAYDPDTRRWEEGSVEKVYASDTIANSNGELILVGGGGEMYIDPVTQEIEQEPSSVRAYDLDTGSGEKLCRLHTMLFFPRVATRDGIIYVFDRNSYKLERVENGTAEYITDALPAYLDTYRDIGNGLAVSQTEFDGIFVPVSDGIMFIGPTAADGSSDTFILREGSDKFEPYEKRMSDCKVNYPAVASYRGYIYAIGTANFEYEKEFFRRTAMDVPEYPGDISPNVNPDTPVVPVNPDTSDHNNLVLWIFLLVLAAGGITGAVIVRRKRKTE